MNVFSRHRLVVDASWPWQSQPRVIVGTAWGPMDITTLPRSFDARKLKYIDTVIGPLSTRKASRLAQEIHAGQPDEAPWPALLAGWPLSDGGSRRGLPMQQLLLARVTDDAVLVTHVQHRRNEEHRSHHSRPHHSRRWPPRPYDDRCRDCMRNAAMHAGKRRSLGEPWLTDMRTLVEAALVRLDALEEQTPPAPALTVWVPG